MKTIIKFTIKTNSGEGYIGKQYSDKLSLTSNEIKYTFNPEGEEESTWSFKSTKVNDSFTKVTTKVEDLFKDYVDVKLIDKGNFILTLKYEDGSKVKHNYYMNDEKFTEIFTIIKELLTNLNNVPSYLKEE